MNLVIIRGWGSIIGGRIYTASPFFGTTVSNDTVFVTFMYVYNLIFYRVILCSMFMIFMYAYYIVVLFIKIEIYKLNQGRGHRPSI